MPSGQPYNGQHVPSQIPPQLPSASAQYPQYGNPNPYADANANAHYQNQQHHQYVQPGAYTRQPVHQPVHQPVQQPVRQFYAPQLPQQFARYDGSHDRPPPPRPPPPPAAPPIEFVNPSFLQQTPVSAPSYQLLPPKTQPPISQPPSQPMPRPLPQPVSQHPSQPVPQARYNQVPSPVVPAPPLLPPAQHHSGRSSVGGSPQLGTRRPGSQDSRMKSSSPAISKKPGSVGSVTKSPSVSHASVQVDTLSLLVCVAEDCFSKARASVRDVGKSLQSEHVQQYHKLIATGLGCLDVVMQSSKISPRFEARIRLRYASVLVEETINYMEAETTLMKGISLCERVRHHHSSHC